MDWSEAFGYHVICIGYDGNVAFFLQNCVVVLL